MKAQSTILVVEDDEGIQKLLSLSLQEQGYKVFIASKQQDVTRLLNTYSFDGILLDLGLPDGDGKELIRTIRKHLSTPIIIVSARHDEKEIILSLNLGADDYIIKPFSPPELIARLNSVLRRFMGTYKESSQIICDEIAIDLNGHTVFKAGIPLKLTPTEFNLLKYFILHNNQVLTHARILKEVWGIGYQHEMQYLRTYINSLRKKIEIDTMRPKFIQTELGIGYRFCCEKNGKDS